MTIVGSQVALTAPALLLVEGQAPAVRFAGRTWTKDEAEQLAYALLNVVTEIDTARWYAIDPELAAQMEADVHATFDDLDDEQHMRIAS